MYACVTDVPMYCTPLIHMLMHFAQGFDFAELIRRCKNLRWLLDTDYR